MFPIKTPVSYSICLAIFVFLSIKELTRVQKLTRFEAWNSCVWDELNIGKWEKSSRSHEFWNNSAALLSKCTLILELKMTKLPTSKMYVFPKNLTDERVHVTFGVENDGVAELEMKTITQNAQLYMTDIRSAHQNSSYHDIGTVLPLAIGRESRLISRDDGYGTNETLLKIDMVYFLREILNRDVYDSIWVNLKSFEFPIMKAIMKGAQFERNGITICQLNFKVEKSLENEEEFHRFFINLISERRYAMIVETSETGLSMFLINYSSSECTTALGQN